MKKPAPVWLLPTAMGVVLLAMLAVSVGCSASAKLRLAPRVIHVTATSPAQLVDDRRQAIRLLDEIAAQHGLAKDEPAPEGMLAAYASPPSKLGLSIAVVEEGDGFVTTVAITPAALGLELNSARKELIAAVETALKQAFGDRYKPGS